MSQKTKVLHIKHIESTHEQDITESEWNDIKPALKEKYKVTSTQEIAKPSDIAEGK